MTPTHDDLVSACAWLDSFPEAREWQVLNLATDGRGWIARPPHQNGATAHRDDPPKGPPTVEADSWSGLTVALARHLGWTPSPAPLGDAGPVGYVGPMLAETEAVIRATCSHREELILATLDSERKARKAAPLGDVAARLLARATSEDKAAGLAHGSATTPDEVSVAMQHEHAARVLREEAAALAKTAQPSGDVAAIVRELREEGERLQAYCDNPYRPESDFDREQHAKGAALVEQADRIEAKYPTAQPDDAREMRVGSPQEMELREKAYYDALLMRVAETVRDTARQQCANCTAGYVRNGPRMQDTEDCSHCDGDGHASIDLAAIIAAARGAR